MCMKICPSIPHSSQPEIINLFIYVKNREENTPIDQ